MKRRLMFLISTEGKSQDQVVQEAYQAYRKYRKAESKKSPDAQPEQAPPKQ
jgi:hypothetical protein